MPTILAIDDRNDNLIALTALLRNLLPGTTVLTALSGPEGIETARAGQPDAIVLDIIMPGMDGYETCRLLQADERTRHIPVIMVTAIRTDSDSRVKGLEFGANAFLSKPIDGPELVSQVKVAFRIKDAEDALRRERDSLERTVAERTAALQESQAMLEAAGRIARFGGWSVDLTATPHRVAWSDEVALIHEMPPGHSPTVEEGIAFYAPESRERIARVFGDCVRDGTPYDEEMEIITARGRRVWVRALGVAQRDASGAIVKVVGAFQDITERKQLESQFLRAQRMEGIGSLANGIAHDLNNILAPILMIGPLLRETVTDPDSVQLLNTIEGCAQRAADIIKQLLAFARGKPETRAPLPVRHLLNELVRFMGETFPRNLEVRVESPDALWPILGDATQIHQTFMNLLVNARDAMPDGGTLLLAARKETLDPAAAARTPDAKPGPYVCVSVADTGTGIAPEHLERIFDPFFTTKEIGKGTGLGLATVVGIVRGHGGFVRVNSRVGEGTRIEVCFPAAPEASAPAPVRSAALAPPARGELVLVVDDEPNVCRLVQRVLERHGYRVLPAANGGEALTLLTRHRAEVRAVVTDLMMPGMQGPTLIQALRRLDPGLPIIAMTGLIEPAKTRELESLGLAAMLPKPFDPDDLLRALHRAVLPADGPPPTAPV